MALPPGVTTADFNAGLAEFKHAIGDQWVFTSDEDLIPYRDAYTPYRGEPDKERYASAAIAPASAEEVQAVVKIANRYKIPLFTISTGKNLGYGAAAPVLSGSVVLDLKRMNRILSVDEKHATLLVEPGVSYFELYRYIQEHKLKLWVDCPDPGWGSVIGNALEHGNGYTPMRDHFHAHCGMELVLANGEIVRTGMGAVPDSDLWQIYKYGFGPYIDGIFSQSNFAVVTKMGFHLMREPEMAQFFWVEAPAYDDIIPLLDVMRDLKDQGVWNGGGNLNSPLMGAGGLNKYPEAMALFKAGGGTGEEWNALARAKKENLYGVEVRLYGPAKVVENNAAYIKDRYREAIRGVSFANERIYRAPYDAAKVPENDKTHLAIPSLVVFANRADALSHGHFFFSPNVPMTGEALRDVNRVVQGVMRDEGRVWGWSGGNNYFDKTLTMIYPFLVTDDPAENQESRRIFQRVVDECAKHGWAEYRTPPAFMNAVMDVYSYNDHALLRLHETIKDAIDPNGILAAGKNGIWPRHLRGKKS